MHHASSAVIVATLAATLAAVLCVHTGKVLGAQGYATAHIGKWHNSDVLGYEPWNVGYNETWVSDMSTNGPTSDIARWEGGGVESPLTAAVSVGLH